MALSYFCTHEWTFKNNRLLQLVRQIRPKDRKAFEIKLHKFQDPYFIMNMSLGIKKYLLKEKLDDYQADKTRNDRYVPKKNK